MVEIADIQDDESLRAWLEAMPGDEETRRKHAVALAHRAAMRVLPVAWQWFEFDELAQKRNLTVMPVLRANLVCGVEGTWPSPQISAAAGAAGAAAVSAASDVAFAAASDVAFAASDVAFAAADAAFAADAAAFDAFDAAFAAASTSAAIGTDRDTWENVRKDCASITEGVESLSLPLWNDSENLINVIWQDLRQKLEASENAAHWAFWIRWYERSLHGEPQDWGGLLADVALIEDEVWEQGVAEVGKRIAELMPEPSTEPAADSLLAYDLMRGALGRYRFDELHHLMRLQPFEEDLAHLNNPQAINRFLRDAADLRRSMENFADVLKAEPGIQGGGAVRVLLGALEREFAEAETADSLAVGQVIELGKSLEAYALDGTTRAEFGPLVTQMDHVVDRLRQLAVTHFSDALLRTAPLADLKLPEDASPIEVTQQLQHAFKAIQETSVEDMVPMSPKDAAAMQALIDSLARKSESIALAAPGKHIDQLRRDFSFQAAQLSVTMLYFIPAAKEHAGTVGSLIGWIDTKLGGVLTVTGLISLVAQVLKLM